MNEQMPAETRLHRPSVPRKHPVLRALGFVVAGGLLLFGLFMAVIALLCWFGDPTPNDWGLTDVELAPIFGWPAFVSLMVGGALLLWLIACRRAPPAHSGLDSTE